MSDRKPVYLDHQSHAPLDPRVAQALSEAFANFDANPHSQHAPGQKAREAVNAARSQVAELIGALPSEVLFTSGATEANNLALRGLVPRMATVGRDRILVGAGEHPSILAAAEASGARVDRIPLERSGRIDLDRLTGLLGSDVGLVSVAYANHELGTIQDMEAISSRVRAAGAWLHSDLAQAAGKIPVDWACLDLASITAHKFGGPIGIGALVVTRGLRRHIRPLIAGGGQEAGLRPGTVPAPLCHAFGEACRIAVMEMADDADRIGALADRLLARLEAEGAVQLNGGRPRLAGNLNLSFTGVDGEALVMRLHDEVAISTGSACTSASLEPSHVLLAAGIGGRQAEEAVRISLGKSTTVEEVEHAADSIAGAVRTLRATMRRVA